MRLVLVIALLLEMMCAAGCAGRLSDPVLFTPTSQEGIENIRERGPVYYSQGKGALAIQKALIDRVADVHFRGRRIKIDHAPVTTECVSIYETGCTTPIVVAFRDIRQIRVGANVALTRVYLFESESEEVMDAATACNTAILYFDINEDRRYATMLALDLFCNLVRRGDDRSVTAAERWRRCEAE